VRKRAERDRVPYDVWVEEEYLCATPRERRRYQYIREKLNALRGAGLRDQEVGYDPWNATALVTDLQTDGFTCVPIRQGLRLALRATKEFEKLLLGKTLRIGGNPARAGGEQRERGMDAAGNLKPRRRRARNASTRSWRWLWRWTAPAATSRGAKEGEYLLGMRKYVPGAIRPARAGPYGGRQSASGRPARPADPHLLPPVDRFHTQDAAIGRSHTRRNSLHRTVNAAAIFSSPGHDRRDRAYHHSRRRGVNRSEELTSGGKSELCPLT